MLGLITSSIITRTTLDLDASVLAQLRQRAREENKSMGQVASERLAASLRPDSTAEPAAFEWPTSHMGRPKVDLHDREAIWRALDSGE
jgi:hypothetical protein